MSSIHAGEEPLGQTYKLFSKAQLLTLFLSVIVVGTGLLLLQPIVTYILPEYLPGIPAARIMLLAGIPLCLIYNANNVLIALQYKYEYLKIVATAIMFQVIIFCLLAFHEISISNISICFCAIFLFYIVIVHYKVLQILKFGIWENLKAR